MNRINNTGKEKRCHPKLIASTKPSGANITTYPRIDKPRTTSPSTFSKGRSNSGFNPNNNENTAETVNAKNIQPKAVVNNERVLVSEI